MTYVLISIAGVHYVTAVAVRTQEMFVCTTAGVVERIPWDKPYLDVASCIVLNKFVAGKIREIRYIGLFDRLKVILKKDDRTRIFIFVVGTSIIRVSCWIMFARVLLIINCT